MCETLIHPAVKESVQFGHPSHHKWVSSVCRTNTRLWILSLSTYRDHWVSRETTGAELMTSALGFPVTTAPEEGAVNLLEPLLLFYCILLKHTTYCFVILTHDVTHVERVRTGWNDNFLVLLRFIRFPLDALMNSSMSNCGIDHKRQQVGHTRRWLCWPWSTSP